jgi:hypothetical protein
LDRGLPATRVGKRSKIKIRDPQPELNIIYILSSTFSLRVIVWYNREGGRHAAGGAVTTMATQYTV